MTRSTTINTNSGKAYFFSTCLLAFCIPVFKYGIQLPIIVLVISWLFGPKTFSKKRLVPILLFSSIYLFHLIAMFYTENLDRGFADLMQKLSLLLFPIIIGTGPIIQSSQRSIVLFFFLLGVAVAVMTGFVSSAFEYHSTGELYSFYMSDFSPAHHPTYISFYVVIALAILLIKIERAHSNRGKSLLWLAILLLSISLVFPASKMGFINWGMVVLIFLFKWLALKSRQLKLSVLLMGTAILFVLFLKFDPVASTRVESAVRVSTQMDQPKKESQVESNTARLYSWGTAIALIKENPFGVGTGDINDAMVSAYKKQGLNELAERGLNPHNEYFQIAVALGILPALFFLFSLVYPFRKIIRNRDWIYGIFLLSVFIQFSVESMLEKQSGVIFFAFFNSLLFFTLQVDRHSEKKGLRLLILTQYYPPEIGAPQNRLHELALRLRSKGVSVEVLTAMPNYPKMEIQEGYKNKRFVFEEFEGVPVYRSGIYVKKSSRISVRLLNYFSFVWSSFRAGVFKLPSYDFIMVESPPLFLGISGYLLSRIKGAKMIFNVSDLWPESAEKLGLVTNTLFLNMATILEEFLYRRSVLITGQTMGIVKNISGRFPKKKVYWLPNGVDLSYFDPLKISSGWRIQEGLSDRAVVFLYAGIIGHAQGLEVILNAAEKVQDSDAIFVLLGDGPLKPELLELKTKKSLENVIFLNSVSKKEIPRIVKDCDVAIVPLRKLPLFEGAIPSKIFENLAMETPVLLGVDGEARDLFIRDGQAGIYFTPENEQELADRVMEVVNHKIDLKKLGTNGRKYVAANFDRDKIALGFFQELSSLHL
jgi:glycosyltransferase involved in cell wall biosynthesis/O-antigen ligase